MRAYRHIIAAVIAAIALLAAALAYAWQPLVASAYRANVAPKAQLADYSWSELASIATEVGNCESAEQAQATACRYGLCGNDGSLDATAVKPVELADGQAVDVHLAGFWHDTRSDGGPAGLTFVFTTPVAEHAMNHAFENPEGEDADSTGGWAASDMRAWLNGDFLYELPADLRQAITAVQKKSASRTNALAELDEAGHLQGSATDWVDETTDKLWLLSASELCGAVPANDDVGIDDAMSQVYAAEGAQYQLFADAGTKPFEENEALALQRDGKPCTWWLRTKTLEFGDGFWLVGTDGAPLNGVGEDARAAAADYVPDKLWGPDHARGVVAGFCL